MVKYIKGEYLFHIGHTVGKRDSTIQKGIRMKNLNTQIGLDKNSVYGDVNL